MKRRREAAVPAVVVEAVAVASAAVDATASKSWPLRCNKDAGQSRIYRRYLTALVRDEFNSQRASNPNRLIERPFTTLVPESSLFEDLVVELITLEADSERAVIVPGAGCQCLSYSVGALDVIAGPPSPDSWRAHPHRGGIPILFPWPGRIASARFDFKGIEYLLPVNEPSLGNAIHGFACERPFRVTRQGPYYVTAILDSSEHPDLKSIWPWPFVLEINYEVGNGLRLRARISNSGNATMPFGLGAHPYFHAPLDPRSSRADVTVQLDADARWPLDARMIPSGPPVPLAGKYDLRTPRPLGVESYDDAFRMRVGADASAPRARMMDPSLKLAVEMRADPAFGQFVVYAPADNAVVALEPYTCAPDAFNLATRGIDSGARELAPGLAFEAGFEIRLSAP